MFFREAKRGNQPACRFKKEQRHIWMMRLLRLPVRRAVPIEASPVFAMAPARDCSIKCWFWKL